MLVSPVQLHSVVLTDLIMSIELTVKPPNNSPTLDRRPSPLRETTVRRRSSTDVISPTSSEKSTSARIQCQSEVVSPEKSKSVESSPKRSAFRKMSKKRLQQFEEKERYSSEPGNRCIS